MLATPPGHRCELAERLTHVLTRFVSEPQQTSARTTTRGADEKTQTWRFSRQHGLSQNRHIPSVTKCAERAFLHPTARPRARRPINLRASWANGAWRSALRRTPSSRAQTLSERLVRSVLKIEPPSGASEVPTDLVGRQLLPDDECALHLHEPSGWRANRRSARHTHTHKHCELL